MRISGGEAGAALTACTITNAIGFYAFMPTDYKGVAELGIISGTGMIISLLVTLTVGPALLRYLPRRLPARPAERKSPIGRVLELSLKWHKRTYAITLAAAIAAVALLPQVTFDYNLLNLQDQKGEAIRTFRELLAETDQSPWHAVALAKNRIEVQALAQQLAQLPEVSQVVNLLDFVPKEQDKKLPLIEEMSLTMGPIAISAAKQPTDDQAAGKQLGSLHKLAATLDRFIAERPDHPASPAAHGLRSSLGRLLVNLDSANPNEKRNVLQGVEDDLLATLPIALRNLQIATEAAPFDEETLPASFRPTWRSLAGEYRLAIYPAEDLNDSDALRRYVHAVQRVVPTATGAPMVSLEAGEAVVEAFGQAFLLALVGIIVALVILLRSVKYTVLVLIPLLLSSLFTSAFTVLLDVPFNFVNIIALPLLLGLGIDSSLHMVHRSLNNEVVSEVLIHTSTARAIFYSALTALVDFASLMLSSHQGTASMGILLTVALAFTLICTLVILPVLLKTPAQIATI
jgi:hopanoid biosynthesis associated RND transporter like protein HpnN